MNLPIANLSLGFVWRGRTSPQKNTTSSFSRRGGVIRPLHLAFLREPKNKAGRNKMAMVSVKRKDDSKYFEPTHDSRALSEDFIGKKIATETFFSKREKHMLILVAYFVLFSFSTAGPAGLPMYVS